MSADPSTKWKRNFGGSMQSGVVGSFAFALGLTACGARVSVGDMGNDPPVMSTTTMGGVGIVPDGTYRAAGTTTGAGGSGSSTTAAGAAGSVADATGGSAGRPDAPHDGGSGPEVDAEVDAYIPVDVSGLGGAACGGIEYPEVGFYGVNVFAPHYDGVPDLEPGKNEVAAKLAPAASLRIRISELSSERIHVADGAVYVVGGWGFASGQDFRIKTITEWPSQRSELLEAKFSGQMNEMGMSFFDRGRILVEYFECGSTTPTGTKVISWGYGANEGGVPR